MSYRSSQPIVTSRSRSSDRWPRTTSRRGARDGAPVEVFSFGDHGEALVFLIDALRDLEENEPKASVALLARFDDADMYYEGMEKAGWTSYVAWQTRTSAPPPASR